MNKPKYQIGDRITKDDKWIVSDLCYMDNRCSYTIYRTTASAYIDFESTSELEQWIDNYDNYVPEIPPEDRSDDYYIY